MTHPLLTALHAALTAAWTPYLGAAVAHERAANALQSLAAYEPGDDVQLTLTHAIAAARQPEYGGVQISATVLPHCRADGLAALLSVLLADRIARDAREQLWDALGQRGLR